MSSEAEWRRIVARLIDCLDRETRSLDTRGETPRDWRDAGDIKARLLADLCRLPRLDPPPGLRDMLATLDIAIKDNERMLRIHLDAMGEVALVMQDAAFAARSDGTYSARRPARVS